MLRSMAPNSDRTTGRGSSTSTEASVAVSRTAGSARQRRAMAPATRARSMGSGSSIGSTNLAGVNRLPPGPSPACRRLIGIVTRRARVEAPWCSWYSRRPPPTAARKTSFTVPPARVAAARRAASGTSKASSRRSMLRPTSTGESGDVAGASMRPTDRTVRTTSRPMPSGSVMARAMTRASGAGPAGATGAGATRAWRAWSKNCAASSMPPTPSVIERGGVTSEALPDGELPQGSRRVEHGHHVRFCEVEDGAETVGAGGAEDAQVVVGGERRVVDPPEAAAERPGHQPLVQARDLLGGTREGLPQGRSRRRPVEQADDDDRAPEHGVVLDPPHEHIAVGRAVGEVGHDVLLVLSRRRAARRGRRGVRRRPGGGPSTSA
jgi:hypothetical protein